MPSTFDTHALPSLIAPQAYLTRDLRSMVAVLETASGLEAAVFRCSALHANRSQLQQLAVLAGCLREVAAGKAPKPFIV